VPLVSVVLAVHDGARYLPAAVGSMLRQTLADLELIVVDDASTDETPTLLAAFDDPRLVVLRNDQQLGLAASLNRALDVARGRYVARMDADDVALPERFERQLALLAEGYDIVGSAIAEIGDDESSRLASRPVPVTHREIMGQLDFRTPFNHPSVMYRASAVRAAGGYRGVPGMEDYWLWARMLHGGSRGANVPEVLVLYRVSDGAYARRGGTRMLTAELRLQRRMLSAGYIGPAGFARNVLIRGVYRLVPTRVRRSGYRTAFTERLAVPAQSITGGPGKAAG
jgi:glycosyltransferase involved in cell wall biosynthesis